MGEERYLIDSNIFIEAALGQARSAKCISLFRHIAESVPTAIITSFAIHAVELILCHRGKLEEAIRILGDIASWERCRIYHTDLNEEREIIELTVSRNLDFDDAVQYYVAKKTESIIVSFDRDFDQLDVRRIEPKDVVTTLAT